MEYNGIIKIHSNFLVDNIKNNQAESIEFFNTATLSRKDNQTTISYIKRNGEGHDEHVTISYVNDSVLMSKLSSQETSSMLFEKNKLTKAKIVVPFGNLDLFVNTSLVEIDEDLNNNVFIQLKYTLAGVDKESFTKNHIQINFKHNNN